MPFLLVLFTFIKPRSYTRRGYCLCIPTSAIDLSTGIFAATMGLLVASERVLCLSQNKFIYSGCPQHAKLTRPSWILLCMQRYSSVRHSYMFVTGQYAGNLERPWIIDNQYVMLYMDYSIWNVYFYKIPIFLLFCGFTISNATLKTCYASSGTCSCTLVNKIVFRINAIEVDVDYHMARAFLHKGKQE